MIESSGERRLQRMGHAVDRERGREGKRGGGETSVDCDCISHSRWSITCFMYKILFVDKATYLLIACLIKASK